MVLVCVEMGTLGYALFLADGGALVSRRDVSPLESIHNSLWRYKPIYSCGFRRRGLARVVAKICHHFGVHLFNFG